MFIKNKDQILAIFGKSELRDAFKGIIVVNSEKKGSATSSSYFTEASESIQLGVILSATGAGIILLGIIVVAFAYWCLKKSRKQPDDVSLPFYSRELDTIENSSTSHQIYNQELNAVENVSINSFGISSFNAIENARFGTPDISPTKRKSVEKIRKNHPAENIINEKRRPNLNSADT